MPQSDHQAYATENLQRYLRQLSYDTPSISAPPVDGIFESATRQSLREFQQSQQLPITGTADQRTWEALYAAYRSSLANNGQPTAVSIYPRTPMGGAIGPGDSGILVAVIQYMLRELSNLYRAFDTLSLDGVFGDATQDAVRYFQERNFLPVTGRVDLLTWNSLTDQYNVQFNRYPIE
ncbi:MAG: peptidoglycan-binding protein [Clostridia bacterium]|nr:peptidoglycan-binding protein [Clostridia bacterium]